MKKILSIAALSMLSLSSLLTAPAQAAGSAGGTFNVNVTLTSKCEINSTVATTGAIIGNLALTYESFQTTAATGSTNFNVRCTNTLPFSLDLDSASVTDGITGLAYTLALSTTNTPSATAVPSLTGLLGTGSNVVYYVNGNIAANLAGTSTPGTDNKQRTLTITY